MYIQNATYKAVPTAGLTFPLAEGTVLTVGDVTGIVPENISLAAPTGLIYLAVGGTIDLTSEANAGVTFTDEQLNELSGDFNFIPLTEAGGSGLPSYSSSDIGKVLTVGEGTETVQTVVVPEQTVTFESGGQAEAADVPESDFSNISEGDAFTLTVNGDTYTGVAQSETDGIVCDDGVSGYYVYDDGYSTLFGNDNGLADGTYTVSLTVSTPKAEPKWEAAGGGAPTVVNIVQTGVDTYEADMSFEEIANAYSKGVVYFNYDGENAPVTFDGESGKYTAHWLIPMNMDGWQLVDFKVSVYAESITGVMNVFDLTFSGGPM